MQGWLSLSEFKKFLLRGNVIDLAVGVLIGVAFKSVVDSVVIDVITPLIAAVFGQPDFSEILFTLRGSDVRVGNFLNVLLSFLITATAVFYFVVVPTNRLISRFSAAPLTPEPTTRRCPFCWTEISTHASRCPQCT
ncbi:MAG: large conductance mechanosensitive channel protein MscL, partial [Dehalococcoidia bacterium]